MGPGADLSGARIANQDLTDWDFTGVNLTGVTSVGNVGTPVLPDLWKFWRGYLVGPGANLSGADLSNIGSCSTTCVVNRSPNLDNANLTNANLSGVNFSGASARNVVLTGANLSGAKFGGLTQVVSGAITGTPAALYNASATVTGQLTVDHGFIVGPNVNLSSANLTNTSWCTAQDQWMDLVNFKGANLSGCNLYDASLLSADLTGANVTGLSTVRSGSTLGYVTKNAATRLPAGWFVKNGYLIGPGANLAGASLISVDLSGTDLTGVSFNGANLSQANLSNTNLTGVNINGTILNYANLTGATLTNLYEGGCGTGRGCGPGSATGILLPTGYTIPAKDPNQSAIDNPNVIFGPGVNLENANIVNRNLRGVDLTGANFKGLRTLYLIGNPVLPPGWRLVSGTLWGPGMYLAPEFDIRAKQLQDVDLTGVALKVFVGQPDAVPAGTSWFSFTTDPTTSKDFGTFFGPGVNWSQISTTASPNLSQLSLAGMQSCGIQLGSSTVMPTGWSFVNNCFVGPGANLKGADLSGANLTGLNLTGADLTGADLTNANLTNVTLTNADVTDAAFINTTLAGVTGTGIIGTPRVTPIGWTLSGGTWTSGV